MKFLLTLVIAFTALVSSAQNKQSVYFLKNDGKFVLNKDSADYFRFITEPDSGGVNYLLEEFYRSGNKKTLGNISWFKPNLVFEGTATFYYENGKRERIQTFLRNIPTGNSYYYYPNGKIKEHRLYPPVPKTAVLQLADLTGKEAPYNPDLYQVLQYADSTGKSFLDEKGTGKVEIRSGGKDIFVGNYINGLKDGSWTEYTADSTIYKEEYSNGILVKGERIESSGNVSRYDKMEVLPSFPGGLSALYKFNLKNISYPREASNRNIRGRVYITFLVEKDGSVANAKVARGIGYGCDAEALRTVNMYPKWIPGQKRGKAVSFELTQPFSFGIR